VLSITHGCLESKQPCVIDNTNPTRVDRVKYIQSFKSHRFEVIGYYFNSSLNDCLERNRVRTGKELIPEVGLRGTYNKLEPPEYSEGFDKLFHVSIYGDDFLIRDFADEL
jgi:predicted kinase